MSKAILVMDMPNSCDECVFVRESCSDNGDLYCNNPLATMQGNYVSDYIKCRPIWCPLRELPQKIDEAIGTSNMFKALGWNECIDEIMRGSEAE